MTYSYIVKVHFKMNSTKIYAKNVPPNPNPVRMHTRLRDLEWSNLYIFLSFSIFLYGLGFQSLSYVCSQLAIKPILIYKESLELESAKQPFQQLRHFVCLSYSEL